ncbi:peptidyl-tRNA hydrolase [Segniliparus rotundus DSM 44985]|uniref:Peptidyl-tRNA hydrolase n=1 Tax=Segniliparus rotundus (strain ATCC BAA-972 / CDC 1076 / CIP 108378 / DSM 44985 / JCM 13578) TaxID=640132 RepID=D6ZC19_SEGRD|nr:peptidyl-tRNA hydrolase [Segniliparus rotundus DSM 44985]
MIAGLGNPGPKYEKTRHNVGHMVVDLLLARAGGSLRAHKTSGMLAARLSFHGRGVILGKPTAYMNVCGPQIAKLAKYFSVPAADVVAVHDELDIGFGLVRLKRGGGEAGHNGLRSLSSSLGTKEYCRVRVGVGRPPVGTQTADFVLAGFRADERKELPGLLERSADAVEALVREGLEAAQNRVHSA